MPGPYPGPYLPPSINKCICNCGCGRLTFEEGALCRDCRELNSRMPWHDAYTARTIRILDATRDDPYAHVERAKTF
jgi:hypothetical protein